MSSRRRIATVVAVVGVLVVGDRLVRAWPREVRVAYEVGPDVEDLAVDYLQDEAAVSSVRFRRPDGKPAVFEHAVRLQPGAYQLHITLYGRDTPAIEEVRGLTVPTDGLARFDLRDAAPPSE